MWDGFCAIMPSMEDIPLTADPTIAAGFSDWLNYEAYATFFDRLLAQMGQDPVKAMWFIISHGGWVIFVILAWYAFTELFLDYKQGKTIAKKKYVLLAIDVPRESEQSVKAVENTFAHLAGAHSPATWTEKWMDGKVQDCFSIEIISMEGHLQYLIRCLDKLRDLVEASIYAQYPTAEISQVGDYVPSVPSKYPDEEYELYGNELMPVKSDVYPIKTYVDFEHSLTGEFKDPLAAVLEAFSRLGPGEQAWYQMILIPIDQKDFGVKAQAEVSKLKGDPPKVAKKSMAEELLDFPVKLVTGIGASLLGMAVGEKEAKKDDKTMKMLMLSPGERNVIEAIERKRSKIQFLCKIRFIYVAKKEVFSKPRILQSFIGAIKQFNANDLQSLKPESKKVGVSSTIILMKERRNNRRKNKLIEAYRNRSPAMGLPPFHLGVDEIASLWHLPVVKNVKAPQLKKTEAKKIEPPINLPFG